MGAQQARASSSGPRMVPSRAGTIVTSARCRNGVAGDDRRRQPTSHPYGRDASPPETGRIACRAREVPEDRRSVRRLFPSDRRPSQMTPGAPPLGGFCAPREREHTLRSSQPTPGRRALIRGRVPQPGADRGRDHRRLRRRRAGRRPTSRTGRHGPAGPERQHPDRPEEEAGRDASGRRGQQRPQRQEVRPGRRRQSGPGGQSVDLDREGTDKIFAVLVEFGDNQYQTATAKRSSALRRTAAPGRHRSAAQRDPGARPQRRQHHAVAVRLQPHPLRRHVLQPDGGLLRDAVQRPLLHRGCGHRMGQGALQRGAVRAQLLRLHRLQHQQGAGA